MRRPTRHDLLRARRDTLAAVRRRQEAEGDDDGLDESRAETFVEYVNRVRKGYVWYDHCLKLAAVLQRVADGELSRVMVFMPPRHGKSELVSRLFSGYYLSRHPDRWVGLNSYGAELAYTLSRAGRQFYANSGGAVATDSAAVKHWETGKGGGLWAAGVGGPITGKGFHLGIIDDPLKNSEEAESEVIREKQKEWYRSTFYTREEPGGAIVIVQTRWHEDDLSGWILGEEEGGEHPERWHVVSMAAVKEESPPAFPPSCTVEPDGRKPGEALCPQRYGVAKLAKLAATLGSYIWNALFQQRPSPPGGGMFTSFPIVDAAPDGTSVRYWDKAGTEGGGDYSAGARMVESDGVYYIVDMVEGQWSAGNREKVIKGTAELDGKKVHVWFEQEPGSGGKESAVNSVKMLAGFIAYKEPVTGDKVSRARPLAAQAEIGNVKLVRGAWNKRFVAQAQAFPNGKNDDMIDAASGAFNKLALMLRPSKTVAAPAVAVPNVPVAKPGPAGIPNAMERRR